MTEGDLMRAIMLAVSERGARVFRNNVAQGWVGELIWKNNFGTIKLRNARPLHAGLCNGSSDLVGWTKDGRMLAIEVKTRTGRVTEEQETFLMSVRDAGGIAGVARSVEEALRLLNG